MVKPLYLKFGFHFFSHTQIKLVMALIISILISLGIVTSSDQVTDQIIQDNWNQVEIIIEEYQVN